MTRPLLTQAARPLTFEIDAINEHGGIVPTAIAGEHPLTIYVDKQEVVTLMTLGAAPEALQQADQRSCDAIQGARARFAPVEQAFTQLLEITEKDVALSAAGAEADAWPTKIESVVEMVARQLPA